MSLSAAGADPAFAVFGRLARSALINKKKGGGGVGGGSFSTAHNPRFVSK